MSKIYRLTATEPLELHVYLESFSGNWYYAHYSEFSISESSDNYRLYVYGFSGTASESLLWFHNGREFSTIDRDNDGYSVYNCARRYTGAWWYGWQSWHCFNSNLNGRYYPTEREDCNGIAWHDVPYAGRDCIPLRKVIMKVR